MTVDPSETLALEGLLRWYAAMGVDAPVDEEPHDRFVAREPPAVAAPLSSTPRPSSLPAPSPGAGRQGAPPLLAAVPAEAQIRQAEALAAGARDLEDLRARWADQSGCGLAATATRMIFAGGTPGAALMLIGGAPEADDERQGEAFAGQPGRLLDAMLRAIGFERDAVYLSNVVPWRPPGGRAPTTLELAICLPFARRHVALAAPAVLVCLGERAAQPLLGTRDSIGKLRGRWVDYADETRAVPTLVTFSPDYLLKQPLQKRRAWIDLQVLATRLEERSDR